MKSFKQFTTESVEVVFLGKESLSDSSRGPKPSGRWGWEYQFTVNGKKCNVQMGDWLEHESSGEIEAQMPDLVDFVGPDAEEGVAVKVMKDIFVDGNDDILKRKGTRKTFNV